MALFSTDAPTQPGQVGFDDKAPNGLPYDVLDHKTTGQRLSELLERVCSPINPCLPRLSWRGMAAGAAANRIS